MLSSLIQRVKSIKSQSTPPISVKRIHVFYEGEVTENEMIEQYMKFFKIQPELLIFFKLDVMNEPTTSYPKVLSILESGEYLNKKYNTVYIEEMDYIIFLLDLDVCYDYRNGTNFDNTIRVENAKLMLTDFLYEVNTTYSNYHFLFSPSFPSCEYAIALGLDSSLSNITCLSSIEKKDIIAYFSLVANHRVSKKRKTFKSMFFDNGKFSISNMTNNSILDKSVKSLPINSLDLKKYFQTNSINDLISSKQPFTYFEVIFVIAKSIIDNLSSD